MTNSDLIGQIETFAIECRVSDVNSFLDKMAQLYEKLVAVNSVTNLTRITSEEEFYIKHVADSLAIAKYYREFSTDNLTILDIGCGAGFPSLVLASAFENLTITALDSIEKKIKFVADTAKILKLNNLTAIAGRGRELNRKDEYRNQFDVITGRAVADARKLYRETKAMPKAEGGRFIFYKTPEQLKVDFEQVSKDSAKANYQWQTTEIFELPNGGGARQFLEGFQVKV
ncbi:16S rRNA (guanine(527)-N(7))-methyltransferase RsmG [Lentisphaerota bacterium WC36G]|nr:16S rRNA (guanine(527)-N(7))-methyltransferase RsmG [Lentisphaerae bacterium WC36]